MKFTDTGQIDQIILMIDEAIEDHEQLAKHWHAKAVCRLPFPDDYLVENSGDNCAFTRWLFSQKSAEWIHKMEYDSLKAIHDELHQELAVLSCKLGDGKRVGENEYYAFVNAESGFIQQLRQLKEKISRLQISFDPLTGIFNRQAMMPILFQEHAYVVRDKKKCCLAMADLDHFKRINDSHGHPAGDRVLKRTAQFFRTNLRPYDALFRYGGEEFLFCLPNTDLNNSKRLLDRLRIELEKLPINLSDHQVVTITVSIGIAQMRDDCPADISIEQADKALYQAKHDGRNRVVVYTD
jgi:diguanylate cyclase